MRVNRLSKSALSKLALTPALVCGLVACSPMAANFSTQKFDATKNALGHERDGLDCLVETPDYQLDTSILWFQLEQKNGVKVGVNPSIGGVPVGISLGVTYGTGNLSTAMHLSQPLHGPDIIVSETGQGELQEVSFDAGLAVSLANLQFQHYSTTPVATLSELAMRDNLVKIRPSVKDEWSTVVSYVYGEKDIEIPVGYSSGVRKGDQFYIYDVEYLWKGTPCQSPLKIARRLSEDPIAVAVVSQAPSSDTSLLTITQLKQGAQVTKYSQVTVSALAPNPQTCETDFWGNKSCSSKPRSALKFSLRLGAMKGVPLPFLVAGRTVEVDITRFTGDQLAAFVNEDQFGFRLKR